MMGLWGRYIGTSSPTAHGARRRGDSRPGCGGSRGPQSASQSRLLGFGQWPLARLQVTFGLHTRVIGEGGEREAAFCNSATRRSAVAPIQRSAAPTMPRVSQRLPPLATSGPAALIPIAASEARPRTIGAWSLGFRATHHDAERKHDDADRPREALFAQCQHRARSKGQDDTAARRATSSVGERRLGHSPSQGS